MYTADETYRPSQGISSTNAVAGQSTSSTGRSCSRVTNGVPRVSRTARAMMARHAAIMMSPSQKGKKPLFGPSVPQPTPTRNESQITRAPPAIRISAVVRSAARMARLLLQQAALFHQVPVHLLLLFHPRRELRPGEPGRLERAVVEIGLELRRLYHFLEEALVPSDGLGRHGRRTEDTAEHEVRDVRIERLLDGGNVLPLGDRDARGVEDGQRPHAPGLPVAHALDGIVDGRVHVLAHQVDAHLTAALEGHVRELDTERLLQLDRDDLI